MENASGTAPVGGRRDKYTCSLPAVFYLAVDVTDAAAAAADDDDDDN